MRLTVKTRTYCFRVGGGKRIVTVKANSPYAAKQKLLEIPGLADGVRYELMRPAAPTGKDKQ